MSGLVITPDYRTTCPWCNGRLYPIFSTPESAPWVCTICMHSWWAAEISEEARKQFRPALCDFSYGQPLADLQALVITERDDARARGTSVRPDQVQLLPLQILKRLKVKKDEFGSLVKLEIARKAG